MQPAEPVQLAAAARQPEPTLEAHLRALSPEDLRVLVERRPEAAAVRRGGGAPTYSALARALATPAGIVRARASLNRCELQLLELALVEDGRAGPSSAAAAGAGPVRLGAVAAELARWGLAFPGGEGEVLVPAEVRACLPPPLGLGPAATAVLEGWTVERLRTAAARLGLPAAGTPPRKAVLVGAMAARLADPGALASLLEVAPPLAARTLEAVRAARGRLGVQALRRAVPGSVGPAPPSSWPGDDQARRDGLGWLLSRALLVAVSPHGEQVALPVEVERGLRRGLLAAWEPEPPALETEPLEVEHHPAEVLARVDALMDLWRVQPVQLVRSGRPAASALRSAAAHLGVEEPEVQFLYGLVTLAGLTGRVPAAALASPTPAEEAWRRRSAAERWMGLLRVGLRALEDGREGGGQTAIALVVRALASLPPGDGATADSLGRLLAWRHPLVFGEPADAARIAGLVAAVCARLGAGSLRPVIGLTEAGRAAATTDDAAAVEPVFRDGTEECAVTADRRVVVAGRPSLALAAGLQRMAELEAAGPAPVYRLTERSIRRALDTGAGVEEILRFLRHHSRTGVPRDAAALVEEVGRHGRLSVGVAGLYLRSEDPALLAEVVASPTLRELSPRLLAPTVAVVEAPSAQRLLDELRRAGFSASQEGDTRAGVRLGRAAKPGRDLSDGPRTTPPARPRLDAREADALTDDHFGRVILEVDFTRRTRGRPGDRRPLT